MALSFIDELLLARLPSSANQVTRQAFGLTKVLVTEFQEKLANLLPVIERILERMCWLQYDRHFDHTWAAHWKGVSLEGYDVIRGRMIDYGNKEYCALYKMLCRMSPRCEALMAWLATYFPSLRPNHDSSETDHSLEMKADIVEIIMAALRGHDDFRDALLEFKLPELFNDMCQIARTVQYIDAFLRTGWIKHRERQVQKLPMLLPKLCQHEFVTMWLQAESRHLALQSLCIVL